MIRVLFVCLGNICRSPMAEFIMKSIVSERGLSDRFYIASAATSTEEIWNGVGNPVYPPAKRELAKHGISCEGKRAVQITKADYGKCQGRQRKKLDKLYKLAFFILCSISEVRYCLHNYCTSVFHFVSFPIIYNTLHLFLHLPQFCYIILLYSSLSFQI